MLTKLTGGVIFVNMTVVNSVNTTARLRNAGGNWIIGTVGGLEVQAKAYDEPSHYGMTEDARISKLWVKIPGGQVLYSYDRGSDVDYLNAEGLAMVVAAVAKKIR